jgi:hypothetical protein
MAWEEPRKTGMQYRRLGNSGLHVSALGLGGWLTYVHQSAFPLTFGHILMRAVLEAMSKMVLSISTSLTHSANVDIRAHILYYEDGLR